MLQAMSQGPALLCKYPTLLHVSWLYQQLLAGKWMIAAVRFWCCTLTSTWRKRTRKNFHSLTVQQCFVSGRWAWGHSSPQHSTPAKGSFICDAPKLCSHQGLFHGVNGKTEVFLASLRLLELFSKSYSCHSEFLGP